MTKSLDKTKTRLNLLGFASAVILVTFLHFYQVFVYPNFQPLPLTQFFRPATLKAAFYQLTHHSFLPPAQASADQTSLPADISIEPVCSDTCSFQVKDIATNAVVKTIPAVVDVDASARLSALQLQFFDPQYQLIGYQSIAVSHPVFYVINFNADLLQTVQLNLQDQVKLEFVNYYPASQQIHFHSFNSATNQAADYLYSALKPELIEVTGQI